MSTATLLTVEQFEQLPDQDGVQFESLNGGSNESVRKGDPAHIYRGAADLREKLRMIAAYDHSGAQEYREDQVLEAPRILPGFQARVSHYYFAAASSSSGTGRPRASATPRP